MMDVAQALIEERDIEIVITGIRPGEKVHEILVSNEEAWHTVNRGEYYAVKPMLPELWQEDASAETLLKEYSSGDTVLDLEQTRQLLYSHHLNIDTDLKYDGEFLR